MPTRLLLRLLLHLAHDHAFQASHVAFFGGDLKVRVDDTGTRLALLL